MKDTGAFPVPVFRLLSAMRVLHRIELAAVMRSGQPACAVTLYKKRLKRLRPAPRTPIYSFAFIRKV